LLDNKLGYAESLCVPIETVTLARYKNLEAPEDA
jgi:hypothetical protein